MVILWLGGRKCFLIFLFLFVFLIIAGCNSDLEGDQEYIVMEKPPVVFIRDTSRGGGVVIL